MFLKLVFRKCFSPTTHHMNNHAGSWGEVFEQQQPAVIVSPPVVVTSGVFNADCRYVRKIIKRPPYES